MFVAGVLVVATATAAEVGTVRLHSMGGSLQNGFSPASREATLLFEKRSLDSFAFQDKRNEHGSAGTVFIGRQARKAVAAINKFFNRKLQARIVSWNRTKRIADCRFPIGNWQLKIGNCRRASHIEQAQPRQPVFFQQTFVHALLLQLLDLR